MIYVLAVLAPPLAVWRRGTRGQTALNLLLWLLLVVPGVAHALVVVRRAEADARERRMVERIAEDQRRR